MAKSKKLKDFDKDKMYRKIMPSTASAGEGAPKQAAEEPDQVEEETIQVHNYMEEMVQDRLDHTIKVLEVCDCERCRMDITAIALNQLPTAYAVSDGNRAHYIKKLKGTYEVKVTAAIIKAIQTVKKNPRH